MKKGDKVLYQGQLATIVDKVNPRCRCKGKGYYELHIEGYPENHMHRVTLDTLLEPFKPLEMTKQKIETHKLI